MCFFSWENRSVRVSSAIRTSTPQRLVTWFSTSREGQAAAIRFPSATMSDSGRRGAVWERSICSMLTFMYVLTKSKQGF